MDKGNEIPSFDGSPEGLPSYREAVLQYLMATESHKRYLVGPRLVQKLSGIAKVLVRSQTLKDPQWLANPRGAYTLLGFLEDTLERPSLIEANKHVMSFFYQLERKRGETMTEWVARHTDKLWEASRSLQRVQREYGQLETKGGKEWKDYKSVSSRTSERNYMSHGGPFRDDGLLDEEDDETNEDSEHQAWDWNKSSWSWSESWGAWSWKSPEYEPPATWSFDDKPFIPEFLAGFLLLHRSGLEPSERSNILASIKGEFTTQAVARALREQWSDSDVVKRDKAKASAAYYVDEDEDDEAYYNEVDAADFSQWDQAAQDAFLAEQDVIDEALEAIKIQKSTLKEARWRQRQIKLGRNFYPPKPYKGGGKGSSKGGGRPPKGDIQCFRCGGPHYQDQCPKPPKDKSAQVANEEEAEIAFSAWEFAGQANTDEPNGDAEEKFKYGIIDSGATASLGSVDALEDLMIANIQNYGDSKMHVNTAKKPTFRFGNGMKKECLSTVNLSIGAGNKKGNMEIHVHDSPGQPVLISRKALAALGAVVDFEENKVIYKAVDPKTVMTLKQAENGHLLMPLSGNILQGGQKRDTPFFSLDAE